MTPATMSISPETVLPKTILIAEDDPASREFIAEILRGRGYQVVEASTGVAALKLFQRHHPDLVVIDIQMPELDGFAVLRQLRHLPLTAPVIAVTAHAMAGDRERALAAGFDEYLTKPVEAARLRRRIAELLSGGHPASSPR